MPSKSISSQDLKDKISRDPFRQIAESVLDYAIFMMDTEGRIVAWNPGAEQIIGYKASEIIGQHFSVFYAADDLKSGKAYGDLKRARREGHYEDEGWRVRKDGTTFWANAVVTAIRDQAGELAGYGQIVRDCTERKEHDEALAQTEERFRLLVEGVPDYAIYMLDPDGFITTWNHGAERIKGYKAPEVAGKHYSIFFSEEDVRSGTPQKILDLARSQGRAEQEGWRIRKDGTRFWANGVVTALREESGELIGFSKITRDVTERMMQQEALQREIAAKESAQQELAKSEGSLRELSLNLLRTQDEERRRIGREMHDSLGQYLSALKMRLGTLKGKLPPISAEAEDDLTVCNDLMEECLKEVRTISYLLYPPMLEEMGLKSAVGWYLDGFAQRSGINSSFEISEDFDRLPRDVELALFRVLQEALTNVHKHSGSTGVEIKLSQVDGKAILEIRDYGKGLPSFILTSLTATKWSSSMGVGLRGMNERIRQLGGELRVAAASPGTSIVASVPANPTQDPD